MLAARSAAALALAASLIQAAADAQVLIHQTTGEQPFDIYGISAARAGDVDGDGTEDWIVGASRADFAATDVGSAYVYSGRSGALLFQLHGSAAADELGTCVGGVGDVDLDGRGDFVVGVRKADANGVDSGTVRVHSGLDGSTLFVAHGDSAGDQFGARVAGVGDVDGDGRPDWAATSRFADVPAQDAGMARVFSGADGSVIYTFRGDSSLDNFGDSIAGAGDVDADGRADVVVGATGDSHSFDRAGSASVFSGATGALLHRFDGVQAVSLSGSAVDCAGDLDGDGRDDVVVGARLEDAPLDNCGAVRVYSGATGAVLLQFVGTGSGDQLGCSVAGGGDVDGDGVGDLACGAPESNYGPGYARVFSGRSGAMLYEVSNGEPLEEFGNAIDFLGDRDGDGLSELLVAAYNGDGAGTNSGRVQVYAACRPPVAYCVPKTNSLGCAPAIAGSGPWAGLSPEGFEVVATQVVNQKLGLLFWSHAPNATPFAGGTLCIMPPLHRTSPASSGGSALPAADCTGSLAFRFDPAYLAEQGLIVGTDVFCQFWSRDPAHADGTAVGLTGGLRFTVCP